MGNVFVDIGMSLDGYIAGPNGGPENPMGGAAARIHKWIMVVESWRQSQSMDGGETSQDNDIAAETISRAGAYVMGRRMFDEGERVWPDPPPFGAPVFVLTNQPREPWPRQGGTTFHFVTDGIESALDQARDAAGDKDVRISGGACVIQQYINAGLVDELYVHLAPIIMGDGVPLFEGVDTARVALQPESTIGSDNVTHIRYQVVAPTG